MTAAARCSDAARERGDVMVGTAPPQRRLLLVETDGGWGPNALATLPAPVRGLLEQRVAAASARVLLIRRPGGLPRREPPWRWYAVDPTARPGRRVVGGTWADTQDLLGAVDAVEQQVADGAAGVTGADGAAGATGDAPWGAAGDAAEGADEPLLLVCTHGRKDVCCAVRGRPVAAALARHWPEQTWECSHTGGDRFAANVILLPDGAVYGGVDPETAADVVIGHRTGAPAVEHLRGRIGTHRIVQTGVIAALARWSASWDDVRALGAPVSMPLRPDDEAHVGAMGGTGQVGEGPVVAGWELDVAVRGHGRWRASIVERSATADRLTCQAPGLGTVRVPSVVGWARLPG